MLVLGRIDEARGPVDDGLAIAREHGLPFEEARLLEVLADVELASGRTAEAATRRAPPLRRSSRRLGVGAH